MMDKNKIVITDINVDGHKISYDYKIMGEWQNCFNLDNKLTLEYDIDLTGIPKSIAVIPLLGSLLPMAWVCNAEIETPICDKTFFESVPEIKKGYEDMYPQMKFGGTIKAEKLEENKYDTDNGSIVFFSGGVDAFTTLIRHYGESPMLFTLWGSDVQLNDVEGWNKVIKHIESTSKTFDITHSSVKTSFRDFLNESELQNRVEVSNDGWWHGFHHGIGIITHGAPIAFKTNKKLIHFASSYTANDKGHYTCASDPTIDNCIKFGETRVHHDGYELNRQNKIHELIKFSKETNIPISLRVCWSSKGGSNCCHCEKCWRTIIAIYAEKADPKEFGFEYDNFAELCGQLYANRTSLQKYSYKFWKVIIKTLRHNYTKKEVQPELLWLYSSTPQKLGKWTPREKIMYNIKSNIWKVLSIMHLIK